jgi:hypothetical protein
VLLLDGGIPNRVGTYTSCYEKQVLEDIFQSPAMIGHGEVCLLLVQQPIQSKSSA